MALSRANCALKENACTAGYGKEGDNTFDDAYVDYLLAAKLNQEAVHISMAKKCRPL